jgi:hypothetical protein
MRWFIAGATVIGAVVARHRVVTRSSARPWASLASVSAVGPARQFQVAHRGLGRGVPQRGADRLARHRLEAGGADEALGVGGHRHPHLGAGLAQSAHQFDRLVGGDSPADAQQDALGGQRVGAGLGHRRSENPYAECGR